MSTADDLRKAKALIEPRGAWFRGLTAVSRAGIATDPEDPDAVRFCALGAILRITNRDAKAANRAADALQAVLPRNLSIVGFNDRRRKHEVLAAFDAAIERLDPDPIPHAASAAKAAIALDEQIEAARAVRERGGQS